MADKKISALAAATTPLAGTEVLPVVQGGSTVQVSIGNVTAGRAMAALSGSFGSGASAYSIGGTQVSITNSSANTYLSIYGGSGSTNGGFLLGGNNAENFANVFWNTTSNYLQIATTPVGSSVIFNVAGAERVRFDGNGNVGIGTAAPASTAMLDVQSTTKGVRFPNMTTAQKTAITPSAGTVVFDTTLSKLCVYSGAAWQTITSV